MYKYTRRNEKEYRRILNIDNKDKEQILAREIKKELAKMRAVADAQYPPVREIEHKGRKWKVGAPLWFEPKRIHEWADKMEKLLVDQKL